MEVHIPSEVKIVEPELRFFVDLMVQKLRINRHKGFVEEASIDEILRKLCFEVEELKRAIESESQFAIVLESADVGNFAFLLACVCLRLSKNDFKEGRKK